MIWTSILGVLTLMMLARVLGFGQTAMLTSAEDAAMRAGEALAGFVPAEAAVGDDGRAALVAARDGRLALVCSFGDRFVVRPLEQAVAELDGERLRVSLNEPGGRMVTLALGDRAAGWARRF